MQQETDTINMSSGEMSLTDKVPQEMVDLAYYSFKRKDGSFISVAEATDEEFHNHVCKSVLVRSLNGDLAWSPGQRLAVYLFMEKHNIKPELYIHVSDT